ncbi:hypothetical protein [Kocuria sp. NPDC057446]|uniref:hypothetical protein n=1 Tax=Kocuria sp. NPDC057446 TaxID=3346137 RepID=UPI003684618D
MAVGGGHGAGWSLVMAAMAVLCAFCVVGLLRRPLATEPVRMAMAMALAMALLHVLMVPLMAGAAGGAHHHAHGGGGRPGGDPVAAAAAAGAADHGIMMTVLVLELIAGGLAAARLRPRRPRGS